MLPYNPVPLVGLMANLLSIRPTILTTKLRLTLSLMLTVELTPTLKFNFTLKLMLSFMLTLNIGDACCRRLKRPMSAWAEMPAGGAPCIARPRPASALPFASTACTSSMAADNDGDPPHLFWTPPKAWMLALMDKGQPLRKKAHSVTGKHFLFVRHPTGQARWLQLSI